MAMISYEIESTRHERQWIEHFFFYRSSKGKKDKRKEDIQISY